MIMVEKGEEVLAPSGSVCRSPGQVDATACSHTEGEAHRLRKKGSREGGASGKGTS